MKGGRTTNRPAFGQRVHDQGLVEAMPAEEAAPVRTFPGLDQLTRDTARESLIDGIDLLSGLTKDLLIARSMYLSGQHPVDCNADMAKDVSRKMSALLKIVGEHFDLESIGRALELAVLFKMYGEELKQEIGERDIPAQHRLWTQMIQKAEGINPGDIDL